MSEAGRGTFPQVPYGIEGVLQQKKSWDEIDGFSNSFIGASRHRRYRNGVEGVLPDAFYSFTIGPLCDNHPYKHGF